MVKYLAVLLMLMCSFVGAAEPVVAVNANGVTDGAWLLLIQGGQVSLMPVQVVGAAPSPTPVPVPVPTPSTLTERAKAIKAAAEKVVKDQDRATTAKELAMLYQEIAKQVLAKKIGGQDTIAFAVKYGSDTLLVGKGLAVKAAWQPVRDVFSEQWTALVQEGGKDADYAKLLNEAADGLNASSPLKEIDPDRLARIMEIIKLILSILAMIGA